MNEPSARYVAIITDGNGRWAKQRGLPVVEGHRAGADTVKARLRDAVDVVSTMRNSDSGSSRPNANRANARMFSTAVRRSAAVGGARSVRFDEIAASSPYCMAFAARGRVAGYQMPTCIDIVSGPALGFPSKSAGGATRRERS